MGEVDQVHDAEAAPAHEPRRMTHHRKRSEDVDLEVGAPGRGIDLQHVADRRQHRRRMDHRVEAAERRDGPRADALDVAFTRDVAGFHGHALLSELAGEQRARGT